MKTRTLSTALAVLIGFSSSQAFAGKQEAIQGARGAGTFFGTAAVGAMAGGPVGLFIGGIAGALMGEHLNNHDAQSDALAEQEMNLSLMTEELNAQDLEIAKLEKMIEEKMQFQMYFETGDDQLAEADAEQLKALSDFLLENSYMHVAIDGHTDPRGTDPYNQILSEHRAHAVADILVQNGIEANRISTQGHGADFSKGINEDTSHYAAERKVKVQVFSSKGGAELASVK